MRTAARFAAFTALAIGFAAACGAMAAPVIAAPVQTAPAKPAPAQSPDEAPMQVSVVRANWPGCEPDCPEWIAARGRIDETTPSKFRKVLAQIGRRKLPVLIDSLGGSGLDGYTIGRMIRAKGLDVSVSQTELQTCAKDDKACRTVTPQGVALGRPKTLGAKCASACVHVLAGGIRRFAGLGTFVGVHQVKSFETRIKVLRTYRAYGDQKVLVSEKRVSSKTVPVVTTDDVYSKMKRFFVEMGVRDTIMPLVMSAPNTKIHLMTRTELKVTNLVTDIADGEVIVKGGAPAPVNPAASAPAPVAKTVATKPPAQSAALSDHAPKGSALPKALPSAPKAVTNAAAKPRQTIAGPKTAVKPGVKTTSKTPARLPVKRAPARYAAPSRGPLEQPF